MNMSHSLNMCFLKMCILKDQMSQMVRTNKRDPFVMILAPMTLFSVLHSKPTQASRTKVYRRWSPSVKNEGTLAKRFCKPCNPQSTLDRMKLNMFLTTMIL
uniref:Uncharacterized protein n=1 Tax=Cacopsylla melanoneura TaxID=428564 RepID=A0A8D8M733_9HEMI